MTNSPLPNFLIIGAQKSASTYVHLALREHPDVCMPAEEIRFFEDPEYGDGDPAPLARLFTRCEAPMRGIKRPDYLARPEVPQRIKALLPQARLIAVLRDPIARLVSAYHYYIKIGLLDPIPIERGLPRLLAGENLGSHRTSELLEYGRYASHLERYLALFPQRQLCVLLQEDIIQDEAGAIRRLLAFLQLAPYTRPPVVSRDNAGLYSLPRLKFLRLRNHFLYDYAAGTRKLVPKRGLPRLAAAGAITLVDRYLLAAVLPNRRPALPPALAERLADFYAPEVDRLEALLGRSLDHWR